MPSCEQVNESCTELVMKVMDEEDAHVAACWNNTGVQPEVLTLETSHYRLADHPAFAAMLSCLRGGLAMNLLAKVRTLRLREVAIVTLIQVRARMFAA
jgi:hypothetical protein